jgi:hypothetical protein
LWLSSDHGQPGLPCRAEQEHPAELLRESVLLNLCSMYELSSSTASAEARRKLAAWAARCAPDDFDLSCIRAA